MDGVTATTAEINKLDGVTATTAELNIIDGVTATTAELNIMDGVTSTTAELNLVDGSIAGTVVNGKAVIYGSAGQLVGTTATIGTLGTLDASLNGTTFDLSVGGNIRADGDVVAFATSDERLKDNVEPIENPVSKLKQLGGYEFDWNDKSEYTGHDVGVLAQQVEQVLPSAVTTRSNGDKAVQYHKIIPLLIETINEQQKQIDGLKTLVSETESKCDIKCKVVEQLLEKEIDTLYKTLHIPRNYSK
jgi:hypothetical protein